MLGSDIPEDFARNRKVLETNFSCTGMNFIKGSWWLICQRLTCSKLLSYGGTNSTCKGRFQKALLLYVSILMTRNGTWRLFYDKPTTAQRCLLETEKHILEDFFSSLLSKFRKYHPSGNLKLNILGTFQSLRLRDSMGKMLRISLELKFTPNTLGSHGLNRTDSQLFIS